MAGNNILSISSFAFAALFLFCNLMSNVISIRGSKEIDQYRVLCAVPGFDYFNLTALPWFVSVNPEICLPLPNATLQGGESVSQCLILMRFCQSLDLVHFGIDCKNSSVCQQSSDGFVSLGAYKDNPFVESHAVKDGFQAAIPEGTHYHTSKGKPCSVKTLITFQCNPTVKWDAPSSFVGLKKAPNPRSVEYDADTCQVKLSFDYSGACKTKRHKSLQILSIGSVVLIVFSITLLLYFVLGCIFNAAKGNTGSQVIPHVTMWSSLIGYISDGFKFVFCPETKPESGNDYVEIKAEGD